MPTELVTIAGTLGAALIAGVISFLAGRGMKTHEWKLAHARDELAARKALYAAFLAETQRLVIQASESKIQQVGELDTLNQQYAAITLVKNWGHPLADLPGIPQHVIQRGNNRDPCFLGEEDYQRYLSDLKEALVRNDCRLHAYVLMTNHVHLLVTPMSEHGVSHLMQDLGRKYVRYINHTYRRSGTLWEGRLMGDPGFCDPGFCVTIGSTSS